MTGTLVPPWYRADKPSCDDLAIVSVVWGLSLGLSAFGVIRAGNQTYHQWKRTRRVTAYMAFIWLELIASTIIGVVFWIFQIHCIMQIIINRIALLAVSPSTARRLRWSVFGILAVINISVASVWIPARLQINPTWIHVNEIYDRLEKAIFAVMDVGLNLYFVYLVRSSLIEYGLTQYVIFHPLGYLVKLHIELSMADLIAKIVKAAGSDLTCNCTCHPSNIHPFVHDLAAQPRNRVLVKPSRIASLHDRIRRPWPAPLRIFRREDDNEEAHTPSHHSAGLRMLPRTEVFPWRSHTCAHPGRKDSGYGLSSLTSSTGKSSTKKGNDHQD
ncbi:hypothetical protein QQX98_010769 [Neonectria punicea]|uniref:Integral membrane protein n=1 Tax=Neonectria punicea TaxID=979145 RepID=A0ABR1GNY6_9HYPO